MYNFNNTFDFEQSNQHSAIPPDYKPELNITDIFKNSNEDKYWKCIGEMQWSVALGYIDIRLGTAQYVPCALILWYVLKTICVS